MDAKLEQLIQNRKDLIEAHKKNNFTDGIRALLTDLYPDTAHFIYELLQNAEDMNATIVRFRLSDDRIDFEHNGSKRTFNVADIDAITNIGHNSQKKDDPTSIGKFGVGFKAVFAYTATPIIHSGEYHFAIKDYFVPEFQGIPHVPTTDVHGNPWTKFSFPFNNPKKSAKAAFRECSEGLRLLDASSILFLRNIQKIEYEIVPLNESGFVTRRAGKEHRVTITYKKPEQAPHITSHWLRFSKDIDITDDQGNPKSLFIAIAFALEHDQKKNSDKIIPVKGGGRVFIYFPAEKEHSGLLFHINAPFASTVARDSVRNCADNNKLIGAVADLVTENLNEIKRLRFMNHQFFEVLPNDKDDLTAFYQQILEAIRRAFQKSAFLPAKRGGYIPAKSAIMGPSSISDVLSPNDMKNLFSLNKVWIRNAAQKNSRVYNFIRSMQVQEFENNDFECVFDEDHRSQSEHYIASKPKIWVRDFYLLCANRYDDFFEDAQQTRFILGTDGKMYKSDEIYILPEDTVLVDKHTPILNSFFINDENLSEEDSDDLDEFFYDLGVQEYGPKVEVEKMLAVYKENGINSSDPKYYEDMLIFAKYHEKNNDIDFTESMLFFFLDPSEKELYYTFPSELYFGAAYGNPAGELLAEIYEKNCLWDGYIKQYTADELSRFKAFAQACGVGQGLTIEYQEACRNPQFRSKLSSSAHNTGYGADSDYTIPELVSILKCGSPELGRLIWNTLANSSESGKYATARYAPNGTAPTKSCDSSLIYYLKQYAWVPNKQGKLYKPEDIAAADLADGLEYNPENKLIAALKIGSIIDEKKRGLKELEQLAKSNGKHLIDDSDWPEYQEFLRIKNKNISNIPQRSVHELFESQKKQATRSEILRKDTFSISDTVDIDQQERNIEATFLNAKTMPYTQRQLFGRIVSSSAQEKRTLQDWYYGKCQMCGTVILGYDQAPHFVAKNIISTKALSQSIRQTTHLAWNSLCLCPNCAMRYDVCSRDMGDLLDQILTLDTPNDDSEFITLTIELSEERQNIHYVPEHFLALKTAVSLIEAETE